MELQYFGPILLRIQQALLGGGNFNLLQVFLNVYEIIWVYNVNEMQRIIDSIEQPQSRFVIDFISMKFRLPSMQRNQKKKHYLECVIFLQ